MGYRLWGSRIVTNQVEDNPTITVPGGHEQEDFLGLVENWRYFWCDLRLERHHVRWSVIGGEAVAGMETVLNRDIKRCHY